MYMPALANPSRETSVFIRGELPGFWPLYLYRPTKTDGLHVSAFEMKGEVSLAWDRKSGQCYRDRELMIRRDHPNR